MRTASPRFSALATTEGEEPADFQILELQKGTTSASSIFPVPEKVLPGKRLSLKGKGQLQLLLLKN